MKSQNLDNKVLVEYCLGMTGDISIDHVFAFITAVLKRNGIKTCEQIFIFFHNFAVDIHLLLLLSLLSKVVVGLGWNQIKRLKGYFLLSKRDCSLRFSLDRKEKKCLSPEKLLKPLFSYWLKKKWLGRKYLQRLWNHTEADGNRYLNFI